MAKKKAGFKVEGKSIKQLMRLRPGTINKMTEPELRSVVTRLASAANKRVRRIAAKGIETPATRTAETSGGFFTGKGKTLPQLRTEYKRVKGFLQSETSSLTGYKKFIKRFDKKLEKIRTKKKKKKDSVTGGAPEKKKTQKEDTQKKGKKVVSEDDIKEQHDKYDKVFRAVERLKELNPWLVESYGSQMIAATEEYINDNPDEDLDSVVNYMNQDIRVWYEEQQKRDSEIDWSSAF